jgi:aminoglycoside/choline kinase family phosphotransferase
MTGMDAVMAALSSLGFEPRASAQLAGDASHRRYFRVTLEGGGSVIAALYPEGAEAQVRRDTEVQRWGCERRLPIPATLGHTELVTVSQDLGDLDLERAGRAGIDGLAELALATLAEFQLCGCEGLCTPPFDAAFFRRELAVFERFLPLDSHASRAATAGFLDDLTARVAGHPYRLVHRDYHVNNLFYSVDRVWAIDYQDMRGGPDTYDVASLLRERAGARLWSDSQVWAERAAELCGWIGGWRGRYWECACQRGLKVVGTFLRLASEGRGQYLSFVPEVARQAGEAVGRLAGPPELIASLVRLERRGTL